MTPHLRGHVRAYVDRALPPAVLHLYDRHLVACMVCRAAADQERRIVASLRSDTGVLPGTLRTSLMSLAAAPAPEPPPTAFPRIPRGPLAVRAAGRGAARGAVPAGAPEPLSTVPPTAPALHRSPMRAAVVASLAAGASVAAAWGLAVSPLPGGGRPPAIRVPSGVASFGAVNYGSVLPSLPSANRSETANVGASRNTSGTASSPFWMVSTTRRAIPPIAVDVPVRISVVSSAQSGP